MSPRAACRLQTLGFEHVYDYMPGKVDWLARGLPREGTKADERRAIDFARQDVVTCQLGDSIETVRARVKASSHPFAFVLSDDGVLLGRLRSSAINANQTCRAEAVMEPGPSTVRADTGPHQLRERLERQNLSTAVVTDPDGRLLGIVCRADLPTTAGASAPGAGQRPA